MTTEKPKRETVDDELPTDYRTMRALYLQACDAAEAANQRVRRLGDHLAEIVKRDNATPRADEGSKDNA